MAGFHVWKICGRVLSQAQLDEAMIGVRSVGLNQIREVKREWFDDRSEWEMFSRRLGVLKKL